MNNPFKTKYSPDQSQTVTNVVLFLLRQTLGFRESTESIMFLFFKYFYSCMAILCEVHTQRRIQRVGYWAPRKVKNASPLDKFLYAPLYNVHNMYDSCKGILNQNWKRWENDVLTFY